MPIYFTYVLTLLSQTASRGARVLLTLYALNLGAQPMAIGGLAATLSILPMFLSWRVGRLSDEFGPRWLLVFGAFSGASGLFLPFFWPHLPALYIAAAMNGLAIAFLNVSLQNLVGLFSTAQDRAKNFSNYSLMNSVASFLGPLFAGFSIDHGGYAATCLYMALLSMVPAMLVVARGGMLPKGTGTSKDANGSLKEMLADSGLWAVLVSGSLVQSGLDIFQFYMPVYAHGIGLSPSVIGAVLAVFALAGFVVRFTLPRFIAWRSEEFVLAYAFYVAAASFLLVPFFKSALTLGLVSFAFGLGNGCGQPITMMLTVRGSSTGRSGEALGLRLTANHLTRVIGPALFGYIASAVGLPAIFWINALMQMAGGRLNHKRKNG